jgi:DNA polymerase-3 subunit delta'
VKLEGALEMASGGRLYPSVILHGGTAPERQAASVELARRLLCERPGDDPAAECRHCRRLHWPGEGDLFHPDFEVLLRDLKTATSVEAVKAFVRGAQVAPFEARGQVFVVAAAETLTDEAANALLKSLEEPHLTAPRHFMLLAPSRFDLLPTLLSRSLAVHLGTGGRPPSERVDPVASDFGAALAAYAESSSAVDLLAAAEALKASGDWQDAQATEPWSVAAAVVRRAVDEPHGTDRGRLLALAEELLEGKRMRLRGLQAPRILEGLVVKHLTRR